MREIEFRAWLKKDKKMVEVKSLHFGTKKIMYGYSESSHCYGNVTCKFDDCELMQFTGLTDKNGKQIFEGDIVTFEDGGCYPSEDEVYTNVGVVVYGGYMFTITNRETVEMGDLVDCSEDTLECEVIGNIYDNPELLGGAK